MSLSPGTISETLQEENMAASSPTVLAHVAWMLRGSFEDLAVEALGYILNRSKTATQALEEVLRDGGTEVSPIRFVQTQAMEVTGATPDLACLDRDGEKHVLIEAKFDAMLTKNQPVEYLRHLPDDRPSVLLVVAPKRRLKPLWAEMKELVLGTNDFTVGAETKSKSQIGASVSDSRALMLVTWEHLLHKMETRARLKAEAGTLRSIAELKGVVEYEVLNAWQTPSSDWAELAELDVKHYRELIDGAVRKAAHEGWAGTEGFGPGGGATGYVRYFAIGRVSVWLGYDLRLWETYGGPLWFGFQESAQRNIGTVRESLRGLSAKRPQDYLHDVPAWSQKRDYIRIEMPGKVELPYALEALLVQLREIAGALENVRLPSAVASDQDAPGSAL